MTRGKGRGFASMSPEQRREASRQGGIAVHEYGTGHKWTREEAKQAGAKGNASRRAGCVDADGQATGWRR